VKKNGATQNLRDEENAKTQAELRRLLYVAMTRAEAEIYLCGKLDTARLENTDESDAQKAGSFFALLQPVIAARKDETIENGDKLFSIEIIPRTNPEEIRNGTFLENEFKLDREGRNLFISKARDLYDGATIIHSPPSPLRHKSVSALKALFNSENAARVISTVQESGGVTPCGVFSNVDNMLKTGDADSPLFAAFGTLVHASVEALLKNTEAEIPVVFEEKFNAADVELLKVAGRQIASGFLESGFGKKLKSAKWLKSEFPFRLISDATESEKDYFFINGTIDLVFESDDDCVYVVDFKTDKIENYSEHAYQLDIYRKATVGLWNKKTRTFIYYMRTGHMAELNSSLNYTNGREC
jgi:ATP-dependent helicase/nuclease subunit A